MNALCKRRAKLNIEVLLKRCSMKAEVKNKEKLRKLYNINEQQ